MNKLFFGCVLAVSFSTAQAGLVETAGAVAGAMGADKTKIETATAVIGAVKGGNTDTAESTMVASTSKQATYATMTCPQLKIESMNLSKQLEARQAIESSVAYQNEQKMKSSAKLAGLLLKGKAAAVANAVGADDTQPVTMAAAISSDLNAVKVYQDAAKCVETPAPVVAKKSTKTVVKKKTKK